MSTGHIAERFLRTKILLKSLQHLATLYAIFRITSFQAYSARDSEKNRSICTECISTQYLMCLLGHSACLALRNYSGPTHVVEARNCSDMQLLNANTYYINLEPLPD